MNADEQKIINGLKQGDNWAYKRLYDDHYVLLCKLAMTFLHDNFLAQSLVDDLIFHLYEHRDRLLVTTSLRAYLVRAVRNRCLNFLELEHTKKEISFSAVSQLDNWLLAYAGEECEPLAILIERELEQDIHAAIERLPAECRKVFKLSRFADKQYEEIAEELGISINTVKYHIKNALAHLKKDLGEYLMG
jgi:RNA polymerase sigma-70 factor (ECF subfamily)